jgi:hypothetical protein
MDEDWDFAIAEWNRLRDRRDELAGRHQGGVALKDEPWCAEWEQMEKQQEVLELALGAYELLSSQQVDPARCQSALKPSH